MAATLPTADDVLATIESLIRKSGNDAFRTGGRTQLYSGPKWTVKLGGRVNRTRAIEQAARTHSTMIDHTRVGRFLARIAGNKNVYQYFIAKYEKVYGPKSKAGSEEADKVMREVSRLFMKTLFGRVATAVCGASVDRIFFSVELPALAMNEKVETINGLPAGMVTEFYRLDPYEAYRLICLAELIEARRYAEAAKSSVDGAAAREDYRERRSLFVHERRDMIRANALSRADAEQLKLARRRISARYTLLREIATMGSGTADFVPRPTRSFARGGIHAVMPHDAA